MNIIIGLLLGVVFAIYFPFNIPADYSIYVGVAILACFDTILGGISAQRRGTFKTDIFLSGFFGNSLLAALITFLGAKLDLPLYLAPVVLFGTRLFNNFAKIRRSILNVGQESYTIAGSSLEDKSDTQL
jgi:small basic protein